MIRQPIVTIMGHVDHGKTSLLDAIRGSTVAAKEAGGITQAIGASIIPVETIQKISGKLLESLKVNLTIPGLLFIDTPGHAAFMNLRKRGGNLADIAVVVIDINEGLMPQTIECLQILKQYKTPFIVAVNKVDTIDGWRHEDLPLAALINRQSQQTVISFDMKLYEIVGKLFEHGFQADRFDRVSDITKQIVLVPTSAKTGEGIPELIMTLTGLTQRFFEKKLQIDVAGPAKGTVLEVKEVKGLGITVDAIIYDGTLKVNDMIVLGGSEAPIATKIKALLVPDPLAEIRDKKTRFSSVKEASAAMGVKISAPDLDNVVAGSPIFSGSDVEALKLQIKTEMDAVLVETEDTGVIIKADTIGSLEALGTLLKEKNIPVSKARVGPISKKDIADAEGMKDKDPLKGVILGFNLPKCDLSTNAKIITADIIYKLIDDYEDWVKGQQKAVELGEMELLLKPCRIELLKGYVFRQSNPAVVGVEVHAGTLRPNTPMMTASGNKITIVRGLQQEQENLTEAKKNTRVAASFTDVIIGRQLQEGDILWTCLPEEQFRKYKGYKEYLKPDDKEALKEIAEIMRKEKPMWGI